MKIDLTGQTFNNLEVIKKADEQDGKRTMWECRCKLCGSITTASTTELKSGHKKSCGCIKKKPKAKDLTGQTINYLKVIKRVGTNQHRRAVWRCKCLLCGKYTDVPTNYLISGNTKSCGCLHREFHKYH